MSSHHFIIPVGFVPGEGLADSNNPLKSVPNVVSTACVRSSPSILISWGFAPQDDSDSEDVETRKGHPACGVVMGCRDGSLYIFHGISSSRSDLLGHVRINVDLVDSNQQRRPSNSSNNSRLVLPSRSSSPSSVRSTASPFHLSRSRVVLGLSLEQVEAPKNYVDFDDEPDKLKDMLKGRGIVKEKAATDGMLQGLDKGILIDKFRSSTPASSSRRMYDNKSPLVSRSSTPASTKSKTPSSLPSPMMSPANNRSPEISLPYSLSLKYHVFLPRGGPTSGVVHISLVERDQYAVCLQEHGDISVFAISDGSCVATISHTERIVFPPADPSLSHMSWSWNSLHIGELGESVMIMACATSRLSSSGLPSDGHSQDKIRLAFYQFNVEAPEKSVLKKVGEWYLEGCIESLALYNDAKDSLILVHVDSSRHLVIQSVYRVSQAHATTLTTEGQTFGSSNIGLPNPFKALKSFSMEQVPVDDDGGKVEIGERSEIDTVSLPGPILGVRIWTSLHDRVLRILIWSDTHLILLERSGHTTCERLRTPLADIRDVRWLDNNSFVAQFSDRLHIYTLDHVDTDKDIVVNNTKTTTNLRLTCSRSTIVTFRPESSSLTPAGDLVSTQQDNSGSRSLGITLSSITEPPEAPDSSRMRLMWTANSSNVNNEPYVSALFPEGIDSVISGCSDGRIRRISLANLSRGTIFSSSQISDIPLNGYITTLYRVEIDRTREKVFVGGADDGSLAFWSSSSLQLYARWTLFITPLAHVIQQNDERIGKLKGSALCIAHDGTVAVVAIDCYQLLYLIPASTSPLTRICIGEDNLLLAYDNSHARLWDVKTGEFWRSMTMDKAEELLKQDGWVDRSIEETRPLSIISPLFASPQTFDSACMIWFNLELFLNSVRPVLGQEGKKIAPADSERLRLILSMFLTPGLHEGIDEICRDKLHISSSFASVGYNRFGSACFPLTETADGVWTVSPKSSALRALAIIACLQALSVDPELSADVNTVITFYATSVGELIGMLYQPPSLSCLATWWFQSLDEFRGPARLLLDAGISRMTDDESASLVELLHHRLPCFQTDVEKESISAATAVFICGSIAVKKYSLLSSSSLSDISKSITIYLHDGQPLHRVLAIDLCARGFDIWQHYVDVIEMLRALFSLSTNVKKDGISTLNVGSHARSAILQIASSHTPLFMSTLTVDIMHSQSVQHRKSIMQVVAFLIRKKPLIVYPNLVRLVEAVVKSLDPNSSNSREATLEAATEILGQVVQKFPTVDFHMASQRLAVGTIEGAIIMFDLKTATRLYVLEGHKKRLAACSFSPDGRRLVTVSLDESVVLVWKVGTSFSSFFNPGAPPRQGNSGSEPFKTLGFNAGNSGNMTLSDTFEHVQFEWLGDRNVKLRIRDITLTFST